MNKPKIQRRPVHGVLLLDKPRGLSSNDALQKAKWLLRAEKAGHTGTLDPLATGLLPLCFGAATKFSQLGLEATKTYLAHVLLGVTTTTDDAEGDVVQRCDTHVSQGDIEAVLQRFRGEIDQTPPIYSALKRDGKPMYAYARAGIELAIEPRRVTIHHLALQGEPQVIAAAEFEAKNSENVGIHAQYVAINLVVTCSKGTYIRSLARDIGAALGCGAHLSGLRRTATAGFDIVHTHTLETLAELPEDQRVAQLMPAHSMLGAAPQVDLSESEAGRFLSGLRRRTQLADAELVGVYGPALPHQSAPAFLGSAHIRAGELIPIRLLSPIEVGQSAAQFSTLTSTKEPS
jgi:tRNA pseudouridine55 synthase